jgi:predicted transcriptional regulator
MSRYPSTEIVKKALAMDAEGIKTVDIAKTLNISQVTVGNWISKYKNNPKALLMRENNEIKAEQNKKLDNLKTSNSGDAWRTRSKKLVEQQEKLTIPQNTTLTKKEQKQITELLLEKKLTVGEIAKTVGVSRSDVLTIKLRVVP